MSAPVASWLPDVPDVGATLRRQWPRLVNRAALALLLPVLVTWLARSLDFYGPVAQLGLPFEFLQRGPFAYEAKIIATVVLLLVFIAFSMPTRTVPIVLALGAGAVLWVGYVFTRLQWSRLFLGDLFLVQRDSADASAWVFGGLVLLCVITFALVEGLLDTRQAMLDRGLRDEDAQAAVGEATRSGAWVLAGGACGGIALALVAGLLRPLGAAWPLHVNPVYFLLVLGLVLVLGLRTALKPPA